jgi:hypothetical protein
MGYTAICPRVGDRDVKLTTHLHQMPRLKMSRVIPLLPHIPSCCAKGHLYFTLTSVVIVGSSVTFKSQPTSHLTSFLPYLHYASLLSFNSFTYLNRNSLQKARTPCDLDGTVIDSSQMVHETLIT